MIDTAHYDYFIIGSGQASDPLARDLTSAGKRVGLAERANLGGSCVNFGCGPTKAVIASARVAHLARRGSEFGVSIPSVKIDFPAVLERAKRVVLDSRHGVAKAFEEMERFTLYRGQARLEGRDAQGFRVRVGEQVITASEVVLNTGTRSLVPPIQGLTDIDFLDAGNWLYRPDLPAHLAIVGGGYIGLEMSQFYRRMGSEVTVIQKGPQVTDREDPDVAQAIQQFLEAEGIKFLLSAEVKQAQQQEEGVQLRVMQDDVEQIVMASHVFVAVGRRPNTDDLGLDSVGVVTDEHGFVQVNERLQTTVEGVWVAGDIRGGPQFTHTSWDDYRILKSQLLADGRRTTHRIIPYAIYTDPELGRVGMTETEARRAGRDIKIGHYDMADSGKATEIGETTGFIKVVIDAHTDRILGASVLASEGAESVHIYVNIMNADAPYTVIRDAIQAHPTFAEDLQSAVASV